MSYTAEANVSRMRQFVQQVQQEGRVDLIDEFIDESFKNYQLNGQITGREQAADMTSSFASACEDFHVEILSCIGQGDLVATHKVMRGVMKEDFPLTKKGEKLCIRIMDFVRFKDGKWVEHWLVFHDLA